MSEILDLLPIPDERDFPAERLEAQRDALVAAVRADTSEPFGRRALRAARGGIARTWLALLGIVALGLALLTFGFSPQQRPVQRDAVAFLAAAATAQIVIAAAPAPGFAFRR